MCPVGFELLRVQPKSQGMIVHVLVIETNDGLVLVDTGFGTEDIADPSHRLGRPFASMVRPKLTREETALAQIERLGFKASDVRHIIPTHLDLDHVGGLPDFPHAKVHVHEPELSAALTRATFHDKMRYRPQHFAHRPQWATYQAGGEPWFGFECVRQLEGLPPEILLVPTTGHTRGHVAVAVETDGGFLLDAGDAYFHRGEMDPERARCPAVLELFQSNIAFDNHARLRNRERLRLLAREQSSIRIFCAHDPVEGSRFGIG